MMLKNPSTNIDRSEISKFESMAEYWWDRNGVLKALHDINPLRVGYIRKHAGLHGKKIIDVGCGGGILSEAMAKEGALITGIDMGSGPLQAAEKHRKISGVSIAYIQTTAEFFALQNPDAFDVVTCMELLEHVPDPLSVIQACARLVKPNGSVFFATINRNYKSFILAIIAAEYLLGMVKRGTHRYGRFIKPVELNLWADQAGLTCKDVTGMHYHPFFRNYSLGGNTHVNYLAHYEKC